MASATQLNILLTDGSTMVVVQIPAAAQTVAGLSGVDATIAAIMTRGGFWNSAQTTFYPAGQIKTITFQ